MCKYHNCLCRSCMNTCCGYKSCYKSKIKCSQYIGFRQIDIFETAETYKNKPIRNYTWEDYGISKERYQELRKMCQSGKYASLVRSAAHTAAPDIKGYIYLSVAKNMSYRAIQAKWELGEIERMPYNHNDFYGYRRLFYHLFDLEVRKDGEKK